MLSKRADIYEKEDNVLFKKAVATKNSCIFFYSIVYYIHTRRSIVSKKEKMKWNLCCHISDMN